jgi:hypothetical protein
MYVVNFGVVKENCKCHFQVQRNADEGSTNSNAKGRKIGAHNIRGVID